MPARNIYHEVVVQALTADGWTITDDPLRLAFGGKDLYVDLGAERVAIAAERGQQRIAVEIQSFLSPSPVRNLQEAVGQYDVYRAILAETEPDRLPDSRIIVDDKGRPCRLHDYHPFRGRHVAPESDNIAAVTSPDLQLSE